MSSTSYGIIPSYPLCVALVLAGCAIVLFASGIISSRMLGRLQYLAPQDFVKPGRPPTTDAGLKKREEQTLQFKWSQVTKAGYQVLFLFLAAITVPTIIFFLIVKYYWWLALGAPDFILNGKTTSSLDNVQNLSFIFAQFSKSAFLDTVELFDIPVSPIGFRHAGALIQWAVFVYRTFVELFAAGFFLTFFRFTVLAMTDPRGLRTLRWQRSIGRKIGKSA